MNPTLVPGAPGEREICELISCSLKSCGLEVEIREPQPGRTSVLARLRGSGGARSLMLNGHTDTVAAAGMDAPFSGELRGGMVHGRGSYDRKGSVAASMAAVNALADAGARLRGDVVLAALGDEEHSSLGTEDILTQVKTHAAIVTEPTALDLCLAHKGYRSNWASTPT